jgi:hypothetical protein
MKSYLFEHYKKKYAVGGKKVPVRKTGMWYQEGDVVVPSNKITMKGPEGEKDYFDSPIVGIGLQSGNSQVMQPGEEYFFPQDNAVLEKKMQSGGQNISMTDELTRGMSPVELNRLSSEQQLLLDRQNKFDAYMRSQSPTPKDIRMPKGLSLSSGATNYARRLNNMSSEELADMPGDISDQVANAFNRGINYDVNTNLGNLGQVAFSGNYNPFGVNSLDNLYQDISYSKSFPKGSIRLSPEEQSFEFKGKQGNIKYKRRGTDEERISELAFNLNMLPNMTLYGKGRVGEGDINIDPRNFNINSYNDENLNIPYNVSGGLRGNLGPLNYDVSGDYNPERGYNYQGSADLSLLKNRLNLSGRVSGNQEEGLQSYSAEARARLAKGLNVKAGYRKSGENPGEFNVGLSYNKFFQSGGMSIPGVNGTMVSAMPTTIRDTYKKKKKKK